MTPAWDESLTEHDVKVLEARPPKPRGTRFGQRPALLVIDMNRGALGDDRPAYEQQEQYPGACGESGWAALRRMQPLIAAARSGGVPVVYSRNIARASQGLPRADDPTWMYSELSPLSELTPEIPMAPGDLLVEKQRASVFFQTNLIYLLLHRGIDTLLLIGNSTSGCVRASAIDAVGYEFKTFVIEECVFDRFELSHRAALFDLQFKYCDVIPAALAFEYIDDVAQRRPK